MKSRCSFQLKYIDEMVFENLRRLVTLKLDGNQLTVIGGDLLIAQKSLEHLGELNCVCVRRFGRNGAACVFP